MWLFRTREEKIRDYAVKIMEQVHGYAASITQQKGNKFFAALTNKSVEFSWKSGEVLSRYVEILEAFIKEIRSPEFTKFVEEDKKLVIDLLNGELEQIKRMFEYKYMGMPGDVVSDLEKGIVSRANEWFPPQGIKPIFRKMYGQVIYKQRFGDKLGIRK